MFLDIWVAPNHLGFSMKPSSWVTPMKSRYQCQTGQSRTAMLGLQWSSAHRLWHERSRHGRPSQGIKRDSHFNDAAHHVVNDVGFLQKSHIHQKLDDYTHVSNCMYICIIHVYIHTYLHYITLYYIILHYITLYYIILHYITLYYIILHYIALYYIILYYIALYCIIWHYTTLCYIILHYITLYYIILHYIAL